MLSAISFSGAGSLYAVALDTLQQVLWITSSDKYIFKYDINEAMVTYTIECPEVPMGIAVDDDSHDVRRGGGGRGKRVDGGGTLAARSLSLTC